MRYFFPPSSRVTAIFPLLRSCLLVPQFGLSTCFRMLFVSEPEVMSLMFTLVRRVYSNFVTPAVFGFFFSFPRLILTHSSFIVPPLHTICAPYDCVILFYFPPLPSFLPRFMAGGALWMMRVPCASSSPMKAGPFPAAFFSLECNPAGIQPAGILPNSYWILTMARIDSSEMTFAPIIKFRPFFFFLFSLQEKSPATDHLRLVLTRRNQGAVASEDSFS